MTAAPTAPPGGFARQPLGDLAANRFIGSALTPPALVR